MKKLYSLVAGLMVATLTCAATEITAKSSCEGLTGKAKITHTLKSRALQGDLKAAPAKAAAKAAPAKAHAFTTVSDLAGDYTLSYTDAYAGTSGSKTVTVSTVDGNDNKVLVNDFFYEGESFEGTVDLTAKTLTIPYQKLGTDPDYGDYYIGEVTVDGEGMPTALTTDAVCTLDIEAGTITFPEYFGESVEGGFFELYYGCEMTYNEILAKVEATVSECTVNGQLTFSVTSDAADIKFDVYQGFFDGSKDNLEFVLSKGAVSAGAASFENQKLNCSGFGRGVYTLFIIGVDAEGNYLNGAACHFFNAPAEQDKWSDAVTAKYVDDYISSAFSNMADTEREVAVQESLETPGFYRVVNPVATHKAKPLNSHSSMVEGEHDHYLYIHAEDPQKVYIEDSPIGFSYGTEDGMMIASSYIQYLKDGDSTDEELDQSGTYGTLQDGVITFPTKALLHYFLKDGSLYYANNNGAFKLTLPVTNAIDSVVADGADEKALVEYFNILGQKVDNPVAGQLVIRRQGSKAQKILVK